jgi:hypothetical protein
LLVWGDAVGVPSRVGLYAILSRSVSPDGAPIGEWIEEVDYPIAVIVSLTHQSVPTILSPDIDVCWDIAVNVFAEPEGSLSVPSPAVDGSVGGYRAGVEVACRYLGHPKSRWHQDADGG